MNYKFLFKLMAFGSVVAVFSLLLWANMMNNL